MKAEEIEDLEILAKEVARSQHQKKADAAARQEEERKQAIEKAGQEKIAEEKLREYGEHGRLGEVARRVLSTQRGKKTHVPLGFAKSRDYDPNAPEQANDQYYYGPDGYSRSTSEGNSRADVSKRRPISTELFLGETSHMSRVDQLGWIEKGLRDILAKQTRRNTS